MMIGFILLTAGYLLFFLYDYRIIKETEGTEQKAGRCAAKGAFPAGFLCTAAGTLAFTADSFGDFCGLPAFIPALVLMAAGLSGLLESLFFCLPRNTYSEPGTKRRAYKEKMYALCRHPGVLWYCVLYAGIAAAFPARSCLFLCFYACLLDVLYMTFQDRCTFPMIFSDYAEYRKNTPFFLPTAESIRACLRGYAGEGGSH